MSGRLAWPVVVMPTDTAGSKGVRRVERLEDSRDGIAHALEYSLSGEIILEEFVEKQGDPSDSDCFSVDGELNS